MLCLVDSYTQTGEEYDEFMLLNSISGIDAKRLSVPGEHDRKLTTCIQLHKID
jgi:hypothetical protein